MKILQERSIYNEAGITPSVDSVFGQLVETYAVNYTKIINNSCNKKITTIHTRLLPVAIGSVASISSIVT